MSFIGNVIGIVADTRRSWNTQLLVRKRISLSANADADEQCTVLMMKIICLSGNAGVDDETHFLMMKCVC
jgi:hypothetical protein